MREAFQGGPSLRRVLAVQDEDDAPPVAAREPLLNLAVEIQGNGRTNFGRHDFHDLLDGNPWFWRKDCQHAGDLGLRRCGLTLRHGCQDRRERQQHIKHFNLHGSAPLLPHRMWILQWYQRVPHADKTHRLGESFTTRNFFPCQAQTQTTPLWYYTVPTSPRRR